MEEYTNQLKGIDLHYHDKITKKHNYKMCDDIFTFDIETTSAFICDDNTVIGYVPGKNEDYWNSKVKVSLPYIWQFSYNNIVYYGREFSGFLNVLNDLPKDIQIIIWVHNLSFEFQFLQNLMHFTKTFARQKRKPIYAISKEYPNITFRCSYMLTRLALEAWGKQVGTEKKTGDLDYSLIRTPLTVLTEKELSYCEYDCLVVYAGIKSYIKRYTVQENIPLTQTGTVRRVVKELLWDYDYSKFIKGLIPANSTEYHNLKEAFAGGYTHANYYYAGETIKGHIEHYDFTSSYPTVMVCEKFPMTPWIYVSKNKRRVPTEDDAKTHAFLMNITFTNISSDTLNTYIQESKCTGKRMKCDNGRVYEADEITLWMTEQDLFTIQETYTYDTITINSMYKSQKGYLPKKFIEYVLQLYENKTCLKGVTGEEDLYLQSKQYINSLYGMMVTAFIQADIVYNNTTWEIKPINADMVDEKIKEIKKNWWDKSYFLNYSWGVWVTAYARRNLWLCIESVDDIELYADTDSIFVLGNCDFTWYNDIVSAKLKAVCDYYDIPFEKTRPKTPKGKEAPLGIFEKQQDIIEFKTLGAKRYVEKREDGKLYLTVSGVNKEAVECLDNDIEKFAEGVDFDKDSGYIDEDGHKHGMLKRLCTYCDNQPEVVFPDGYISKYKYGINLRPSGYVLTLTDDYKELINTYSFTMDTAPDIVTNYFRSRFKKKEGKI